MTPLMTAACMVCADYTTTCMNICIYACRDSDRDLHVCKALSLIRVLFINLDVYMFLCVGDN